MKNESIEFHLISEEKNDGTRVRQFFRIPVSGNESVQVQIKAKNYSVLNISRGGIRIGPDSPSDLKSGQILPDCELILANARIKGLTGKIIHHLSAASGPLQYAIQWIDLQTGQKQALDKILSRMKVLALGNNDRTITKS